MALAYVYNSTFIALQDLLGQPGSSVLYFQVVSAGSPWSSGPPWHHSWSYAPLTTHVWHNLDVKVRFFNFSSSSLEEIKFFGTMISHDLLDISKTAFVFWSMLAHLIWRVVVRSPSVLLWPWTTLRKMADMVSPCVTHWQGFAAFCQHYEHAYIIMQWPSGLNDTRYDSSFVLSQLELGRGPALSSLSGGYPDTVGHAY